MRQKKTAFFGFQSCDARAAQDWLEEQYAKGWELTRLKRGWGGMSLAKFRRRSEEFTYCVDVAANPLGSFEKRDAYLALCAEAGWDLVGSDGGLFVFRSAPGARPAPIHTDLPLEGRRFWKESLLPGLVTALLCLAILALGFGAVFAKVPLYRVFLWDYLWIWCALVLVFLVLSLLSGGATLLHSVRLWSALKNGDPPPRGNARRLRMRSAVMALVLDFFFLGSLAFQLTTAFREINSVYDSPYLEEPLILTWEALGQEGWEPLGRVTESYFLRSVSYHQALVSTLEPTPTFSVDYFDCRYDWTADLVCADLLREADFTAADLGFDESYTAREGEKNYLILRQGNTAAIFKGHMDFTAPDVLAVLREEVSS